MNSAKRLFITKTPGTPKKSVIMHSDFLGALGALVMDVKI
jgi:hypothetical protein